MSTETNEAVRRKIKVTSKGEKTRKLKCKPGFTVNDAGSACVPMSGQEKRTRRKAAKKSARKRKSKSQAPAKRKRLKALKRRKSLGLKSTR